MAKYIDADLLRKEIERRMEEYNIQSLRGAELSDLLSFIDSLQQEQQEVDLEKEVETWYGEYAGNSRFDWNGFARHFYELGRQSKPEVRFPHEKDIVDKVFGTGNLDGWEYDEATALVALAKEELLKEIKPKVSEELEEEIKRYIPRDQCPVPDFMEAVARHFAEWGTEHLRDTTKMTDKSLEEAADIHEAYYDVGEEHGYLYCLRGDIKNAFIAGAEWQARQLLQGSPMPEDTVLFNKGVAEGRRLEREDMLKDAVEEKPTLDTFIAAFKADIEDLEDKARMVRISKDSTTKEAVFADGQVKAYLKIRELIGVIQTISLENNKFEKFMDKEE